MATPIEGTIFHIDMRHDDVVINIVDLNYWIRRCRPGEVLRQIVDVNPPAVDSPFETRASHGSALLLPVCPGCPRVVMCAGAGRHPWTPLCRISCSLGGRQFSNGVRQQSLPKAVQSTVGCDGRAADARTPVRPPSDLFRLSGIPLLVDALVTTSSRVLMLLSCRVVLMSKSEPLERSRCNFHRVICHNCGTLPLAVRDHHAIDSNHPLVISLVFGLLVSMVLVAIALPALYVILDDLGVVTDWRTEGV